MTHIREIVYSGRRVTITEARHRLFQISEITCTWNGCHFTQTQLDIKRVMLRNATHPIGTLRQLKALLPKQGT